MKCWLADLAFYLYYSYLPPTLHTVSHFFVSGTTDMLIMAQKLFAVEVNPTILLKKV